MHQFIMMRGREMHEFKDITLSEAAGSTNTSTVVTTNAAAAPPRGLGVANWAHSAWQYCWEAGV